MNERVILMNYRYVMFGDFSSVYNNIQEIAKRFPTVEYIRSIENNTAVYSGFPQIINVYVFSSKDITVRIAPSSIDFLLKRVKSDDLLLIQNCLSLFKDSNDCNFNYSIMRIAINLSYFYPDEKQIIANKLCSKISLINDQTNPRELLYRQNQLVTVDELPFNNIVTIQNSGVLDKTDFKNVMGMSLSFDINSDPGKVTRISKERVIEYFENIKEIALKEKDEIESKIL